MSTPVDPLIANANLARYYADTMPAVPANPVMLAADLFPRLVQGVLPARPAYAAVLLRATRNRSRGQQ